MRRVGAVARGLGALGLLVALLVGVPWLLVRVAGWPLPTAVPSLDQVGDALTGHGVSDSTIVKLVALVVWLVWVQLAVCIGAELAGHVRRRAVRPVPAAAPLRQLAGSLVAASMTIVASLGAVRPVGARAVAVPVAVMVVAPTGNPPGDLEAASTAGSRLTPSWVVAPRDTLWGIAEASLGKGERWREIQRLNLGREVAPGEVFEDGSGVLHPGWRLLLPAGAQRRRSTTSLPSPPSLPSPSLPAPAATAIGSAHMVVKVAPGDTLTGIARRVYGDPLQWRRIWEANRGRTFASRTFTDPNLIYVGWALDVPLPTADVRPGAGPAPAALLDASAASAEPSAPVVASATTVALQSAISTDPGPSAAAPAVAASSAPADPSAMPSPPSAPAMASTFPRQAAPTAEPEPPVEAAAVGDPSPTSPWALVTGLTGATLLATGLTSMVASRRRRRLERTTIAETVPLPDPDLVPLERAARLGADPLAAARVDVALRALAAASTANPGPRPVAVRRLASGDLDVLLADPWPAPAPWLGDRDDCVWYLPASVPLATLAASAAGVPAPCPALVLLGVGGGAELYVDLEAVGTLVIEGPPASARAIARAVIATLAVSPLAERVHVVAAGTDCYGFANEERVQAVADGGAALDLAGSLALPVQRALDQAGVASTFRLRGTRREELWEPAVVVAVGGATRPEEAAALAHLAGQGGRGLALLTDVDVPGATWRLVLDGDGWRVEPLGLRVLAQGLAADELADAGALLADAAAPPVPTSAPGVASATDLAFVEPAWSLLVRLLGPVEVVDREGRRVEFERSKALELVTWLAQHRVHPTRSAARTALWEAEVRDATFANVVSDARRALARMVEPPDGEEWIARTYADDLPLHPLVVTDADLLAARLAHARRQPDGPAIATLREGLELVRDLPYAGSSYLWPDGEALPSHLSLLVIGATVEMAMRCMADNDADGVFWATSQGMRVLPAHDELVCLRLRAHALQGNLAGVRHEYEGYERAITADPWGDGSPSAKVVEVRNELLRPAATR